MRRMSIVLNLNHCGGVWNPVQYGSVKKSILLLTLESKRCGHLFTIKGKKRNIKPTSMTVEKCTVIRNSYVKVWSA
jgi:hypothetical protein